MNLQATTSRLKVDDVHFIWEIEGELYKLKIISCVFILINYNVKGFCYFDKIKD
jgi:hypothetical protein